MPKGVKKVRDKWRTKDWYTVNSPPYFGGVSLGSTPCDDPAKLVGRVIETTLYDITGDFSQQSIKLYFQVVGVEGRNAETIFKGHEYARDYFRSLVRRGSTRIDGIFNVTTKDGHKLRVSVVAFSVLRVDTSQIKAVRTVIQSIMREKAENLNFDQFVQEAVLGKVASDIYNEAKRVIPLRHVGVRKSKLITYPGEGIKEAEGSEAKAA